MIKYQIIIYSILLISGIIGGLYLYQEVAADRLEGYLKPKTMLMFLICWLIAIYSADRLFLLF
jgi:hypothetical protein